MGDVADRIDVRHRSLRQAVDGDAAILRIDGDAGLFQAEIGDVGMAADREHHLVGGDARAVRQMRGEFVAVLVDLVDGAAGEDGDAALFHFGAHMRAHVVVEAAQDVVAAIDQRHVASRSRRRCRRIRARYSRRPGSRCASAVRRDETPRWRRSHARCREWPARGWARRRSRSARISRDRLAGRQGAACAASSNTARVLTTSAPAFSTLVV